MAIYPWQESSWAQLMPMRARLPHALLFYGPEGVGKADFLEAFAQALLCENNTADGHACGSCASCGWFVQRSHPDYRLVRPEALDDEAPEGEEGEGEAKKSKSSRAPSKDIRIEQVRALTDFMNISTHRQGLRVVVLYPAEALNSASANALLKTLEEPPPGTVFLLATHSIDRLLPTILSRCRKFALPLPDADSALAWLSQQGVDDAEGWLREQGGAPLAALAASGSGGREDLDALLGLLARPSVESALKVADKLAKVPLPVLVSWQQRWLYDVLASKLTGGVRYYPRYRKELEALAARVPTPALLKTIKRANERKAVAEHPLSAKLFVEEMLLDYTASCT